MITQTYSTKDFYQAAFLIASGHPLVSDERENRITKFIFSDTSELHELSRLYFASQATVEPLRFANAIRNLKSLLHSSPLLNENGNSTCTTIQDNQTH